MPSIWSSVQAGSKSGGTSLAPQFAKTMLDLGAVMTSDTPAEFAAFMNEDHAKWQKVIRDAGIKLE